MCRKEAAGLNAEDGAKRLSPYPMTADDLKIFALTSSRAFGAEVSLQLGVTLSAHEEREFEDGEHKARPLVSVRGGDVYVIQSLHADAQQSGNDKLCRLLFFIGALKDAAAARVTAVIPYLAYARKDRKSKPRGVAGRGRHQARRTIPAASIARAGPSCGRSLRGKTPQRRRRQRQGRHHHR